MTESTTSQVPGLAEVLERLDRLEVALRELIEVTQATRSAAPAPRIEVAPARQPVAPPVPAGLAAPGEPPLIYVAPPRVARDTRFDDAPRSHEIVENSLRAYDPNEDRPELQPPPPNASILQVLTRVFEAGLMEAPEDTWALMTRLTHPSQMQGPRALDHFKAFNWHKLRRTARQYLRTDDPSSYTIAYTDPAEITSSDDRVRVFLKVDDRMPVPVGFARDKTQNNAWRVTIMSI